MTYHENILNHIWLFDTGYYIEKLEIFHLIPSKIQSLIEIKDKIRLTELEKNWIETYRDKLTIDNINSIFRKKFKNSLISEIDVLNYFSNTQNKTILHNRTIDIEFLKFLEDILIDSNSSYNKFLKFNQFLDNINFPEYYPLYIKLHNIYDLYLVQFTISNIEINWIKRNLWRFSSIDDVTEYLNINFSKKYIPSLLSEIIEYYKDKQKLLISMIIGKDNVEYDDIINFGKTNKIPIDEILEIQEIFFGIHDFKL